MKSEYIYAGTRATVLAHNLLNDTQLERLLGASDLVEGYGVLHDTYLAPYAPAHTKDDLEGLLDDYYREVKKTVALISPVSEPFLIFWLKNDFYNIATITKAKKINLTGDEIMPLLRVGGTVSPVDLYRAYEGRKLNLIDGVFKKAAEEMVETDEANEIDMIADRYYFEKIAEIANNLKSDFIKDFVKIKIDLFNIRNGLRAKATEGTSFEKIFIKGGEVYSSSLLSKDDSLRALRRRGGRDFSPVIEDFEKNGQLAVIEKKIDEYLHKFLKANAREPFSLAAVFAYVDAVELNAETIRAIFSAKLAGMEEKEIRTLIRKINS
ncbi:MAG: hypothetical protein COV70_03685 [Parcubacteria group bacterium CG11_big_fil_rev_8_21_14_0_20_39_22]|nr:MAG: hypothetical protein COV70_03685 [Parcubacteria group bacterium CG11_big_fil_rev_8_21_14_0_20_39_22]